MPWQGRPQPAAPGLGVALGRAEGLAALSGRTGGWAWKGPGHPVDNGDQARGQRDGLRSEGAARVLFFRGSRRMRHESEGSFVAFTGGVLCGGGAGGPKPERGYHGLHCL